MDQSDESILVDSRSAILRSEAFLHKILIISARLATASEKERYEHGEDDYE